MEAYKVYLTKPAENDLSDIVKYVSSQLYAPTTALNMILTIKGTLAKLETMPTAYPLVIDERLANMGYRLLPVKNYLVFYVINEKEGSVNVDRILYGHRNWRYLL
jgi:plasmid stabilization system protein ParE